MAGDVTDRAAIGRVHRITDAFLATGPPDGASFVNISSVVGIFMAGGEPWHSAAKTAIAGDTRDRAVLPVDGALSITG